MKVVFSPKKADELDQLHNYRHWFKSVSLSPTPVFDVVPVDWYKKEPVGSFYTAENIEYRLHKDFFTPFSAKPLKDWL